MSVDKDFDPAIMFVDRHSGQVLNGKLMPEKKAALKRIVAGMELHCADLVEGESFNVRVSVVKGQLVGLIEPKRIHIR